MVDAIKAMEALMPKELVEQAHAEAKIEIAKIRRAMQKEAQAKQSKRRALHV